MQLAYQPFGFIEDNVGKKDSWENLCIAVNVWNVKSCLKFPVIIYLDNLKDITLLRDGAYMGK